MKFNSVNGARVEVATVGALASLFKLCDGPNRSLTGSSLPDVNRLTLLAPSRISVAFAP